jgi:geranylgeranyl reductase family protein
MGLRTLLLDRRPKSEIGNKVCGDEISRSHFEATGIEFPRGDQVSSVISGADVYPPNLQNELKVRGWREFDGWTVNRLLFGQRLLKEAIEAGVKFQERSHVSEPIIKNDAVLGVTYRKLDSDEEVTRRSKLVVDASGFSSVIRNKLDSPYVEKEILKSDIALCYREVLELRMPLAEPEVARVFLGGEYSPSGYAWVFPKGPQTINAGVGVTGGKGKGSPKKLFQAFKDKYPLFYGSKVLVGNGGAVPVRRPLWSLVADGVAFVGDSALMVNPIHGGGIGAGMRAGIILGEVAKEAIARRNLTARGLWDFNTRFLANFGRRLASLEIFKRLLVDVIDEDINFGFEKRVLEAGDLMSANRGDGFNMGVAEKLRRVKRSAARPKLLLRIQKAASLMKKMNKTYRNYPARPDGLDKWKQTVDEIIQSAVFV